MPKKNRIKVSPEGREGVYIPTRATLIKWIKSKEFETIHHAYMLSMAMVGADWGVKEVIELINKAERVAVLTEGHENIGHSLAIIHEGKLEILDIGIITKADLDIKQ